jgi:hypothetical protein
MKKICKLCGSENVRKDAWASWDSTINEWILNDVFDYEHCEECEGETTIIDKEE